MLGEEGIEGREVLLGVAEHVLNVGRIPENLLVRRHPGRRPRRRHAFAVLPSGHRVRLCVARSPAIGRGGGQCPVPITEPQRSTFRSRNWAFGRGGLHTRHQEEGRSTPCLGIEEERGGVGDVVGVEASRGGPVGDAGRVLGRVEVARHLAETHRGRRRGAGEARGEEWCY